MSVKTRTMDLSKFRDLDIRGITIRTTNGKDTLDAAARCIPVEPGSAIDPNIFGLQMRQHTVLGGIVAYTSADNRKVVCNGPCLEALDWSNRTRDLVGEFYDYVNGISEEERSDFKKALAASTAGAESTSTSQTSSAA